MPLGIHRYAYASARPTTPNTTRDPLGLAPGATVTVYRAGTLTLASLYTNQSLTTPLGNPFVSDVNAFYAYYADPAVGDLDEKFSGTDIDSPYTLASVLDLDPRIGVTEGDVTTIAADLAAEIADREAADAAITAVGMGLPLGGSLESGQQNATRVDAYDPIDVVLNGTTLTGWTATVRVRLKTDDAGTSVTAVLRNLTDSTDAGTSAASVSTSGEELSFTATLAAGLKTYRLQLIPQNANSFIYGAGYVALTK